MCKKKRLLLCVGFAKKVGVGEKEEVFFSNLQSVFLCNVMHLIRHDGRQRDGDEPDNLARPRYSQRTILLLLLVPRSPCRVAPAAVPAAAAAALLMAVGRAVAVALGEWQFLARRVSGSRSISLRVRRWLVEVVALPWLLRRCGLAARAAEVDGRFLDVADAGFVLPCAVLRIFCLNPGYDRGMCTAAAIIRSRWPLGGLDLVSRTPACRNIAVALEDLLCGNVARVVEEGGIIEDRLKVFGYLIISLACHSM